MAPLLLLPRDVLCVVFADPVDWSAAVVLCRALHRLVREWRAAWWPRHVGRPFSTEAWIVAQHWAIQRTMARWADAALFEVERRETIARDSKRKAARALAKLGAVAGRARDDAARRFFDGDVEALGRIAVHHAAIMRWGEDPQSDPFRGDWVNVEVYSKRILGEVSIRTAFVYDNGGAVAITRLVDAVGAVNIFYDNDRVKRALQRMYGDRGPRW
jgi:hypothetical protein